MIDSLKVMRLTPCFRDVFGLPARKDRRIGTLDGRYADGLVEATYNI